MNLRALRNMVRPLLRTALACGSFRLPAISPSPAVGVHHDLGFIDRISWISSFRAHSPMNFHSLTDTRFPKRRPGTKPRRKRASLKPPGPYAWVQYVPGEPIPASRPNEGSIKARGRKDRKHRQQRREFILAERKKRKAQLTEAKRKKLIKRKECKIAAAERERAWAERLAELQQLELEAKKTES